MESPLHSIEVDAYAAVLKAFVAQSDVLSWEKEELISDLRKELRVSDEEHRDILTKVNADESIKATRWDFHKDGRFSREQMTAGRIPLKKLKTLSAKNIAPPASDMVHERETTRSSHENQRFTPRTGMIALAVDPPGQISGHLQENSPSLGPNIIEILSTEEVIREVERVYREENPDPLQVEKVKFMLREQERALVQAIAQLTCVEGRNEPTDMETSTLR